MRRQGMPTLALVVLLAACCARLRHPAPGPVFTEAGFAAKPIPSYTIAIPRAGAEPNDTVVGAPRSYRVKEGDTLLDVARWFDLGYAEIVDANPGVDPWLPPVGATVVIPTAWVLPCCTYEGLVLNIPEMRLYYYTPAPDDPRRIVVSTYPVGLGRRERRTPRGTFKVIAKTVNPSWVIPARIREEHIRERGDNRTVIPGGAADNPLGKYRLSLSVRPYSIHGTDIPWGVGMEVSHGCARLYPEDIERLFPLIPVGTPVRFVYQPVKVGRRGRRTYVEAHADIYGLGDGLGDSHHAARLPRRTAGLDVALVRAEAQRTNGVPRELPARR